jgi:hypothetical protein
MMTGRELFDKFLQGEPGTRPAYIPLLQGLTARVAGVSREILEADPTLWANALMKTGELLELDGIMAGFDFTLLAEACGAEVMWKNDRPEIVGPVNALRAAPQETGRLSNALEVATRVFQVCRTQRACLVSLTGPVTLAAQLFGPEEGSQRIGEIKQVAVKVAETFCQTRPDVVVFTEGYALTRGQVGPPHRRIYTTLKNVASYYNIPVALYLEDYDPQELQQFSSLNADIYILGPSVQKSPHPLAELSALGEELLGMGIGLPGDNSEKAIRTVHEVVLHYQMQGKHNFFFTSLGPVTRKVDIESLRELIKAITQIRMQP